MKLARHVVYALAAILLLLLGSGCSDRNPTELEVARAPVDPLVFDDAYSPDVYFQPFFETNYVAVQLDSVWAYGGFAPDGAKSLKITVPAVGSALGPWSGGVLTSSGSRDLTDFNALTFYARSSVDMKLNVVGFGNDNTGTSLYEASRGNEQEVGSIPLTGDWTFHVVPIPAPSKLIAERGLFTFAEGANDAHPEGYTIWLDEIRYARLDNIHVFRPLLPSVNRRYFIGSTVSLGATSTVFEIDGAFVSVNHSPYYFDYSSSDPSVARVVGSQVRVVGTGEATVTATLEGAAVQGSVRVTGHLPPSVAADPPTLPASDVISLFSGVYNDIPVDSWRTDWSPNVQLEEYVVASDAVKMYAALAYVGIDFQGSMVDASQMEYLHLDVYAPAGTDFKVKPVSFPSGAGGGSLEPPDVVLNAASDPVFVPETWCSLDIPLSSFLIPQGFDWAHIGQLVLSSATASLVLVDNVYWHK